MYKKDVRLALNDGGLLPAAEMTNWDYRRCQSSPMLADLCQRNFPQHAYSVTRSMRVLVCHVAHMLR